MSQPPKERAQPARQDYHHLRPHAKLPQVSGDGYQTPRVGQTTCCRSNWTHSSASRAVGAELRTPASKRITGFRKGHSALGRDTDAKLLLWNAIQALLPVLTVVRFVQQPIKSDAAKFSFLAVFRSGRGRFPPPLADRETDSVVTTPPVSSSTNLELSAHTNHPSLPDLRPHWDQACCLGLGD